MLIEVGNTNVDMILQYFGIFLYWDLLLIHCELGFIFNTSSLCEDVYLFWFLMIGIHFHDNFPRFSEFIKINF